MISSGFVCLSSSASESLSRAAFIVVSPSSDGSEIVKRTAIADLKEKVAGSSIDKAFNGNVGIDDKNPTHSGSSEQVDGSTVSEAKDREVFEF